MAALFLPMAIAAAGTLLSIWGIWQVKTQEDSSQKVLLAALARGINISTGLIIVASFVLTFLLLGWSHLGVAVSVIVGLLAGWLIGKWTEYSTSNEYKPTRELTDQALTGPATIIIGGVAEGMLSTWARCSSPVLRLFFHLVLQTDLILRIQEPLHWGSTGSALRLLECSQRLVLRWLRMLTGRLPTMPAAMHRWPGFLLRCESEPMRLDALGNTTAATGKDLRLGPQALTALALLAAYVEEIRIGFDRWGQVITENVEGTPEQFVTHNGERKNLNPGDWVKLSSGVAVQVGAEPKLNTTWLVLDSSVLDGFAKQSAGSVIAGIPSDAVEKSKLGIKSVKTATMADYMRFYDVTLMNPKVLVGLFIGAMSTFVFCALTMKAVGRAAKGMVEEVRRQFREKPGIMAGTEMPDYAALF